MNHLAHLYLSQAEVDLMIGNFIGDHVRGKKIEAFSPGIRKGIMMHRQIDLFTDNHPLVSTCKQRLYPKFHKYASVIIDVFFDYCLAINWNKFSQIPLSDFSQHCYQILSANTSLLPEKSIRILKFMIKEDWLLNYANLEGIDRTLIGLSKRAKFESKMELATQYLKNDIAFYEQQFLLFFPVLKEYIDKKFLT